jgi:hypothetical protein
MSKLVSFGEDRIPRAHSLALAEAVGKPHNLILRDIKELPMSDEFRAKHFRACKNGVDITEEGFAYLSQCYRSRQANEAKEKVLAEFAKWNNATRTHSKYVNDYQAVELELIIGSLYSVAHQAELVSEGRLQYGKGLSADCVRLKQRIVELNNGQVPL